LTTVKLKALASWIFLSFTRFWRNSDSYEYKHKSARRGAQFVHIGMQTTCCFTFLNFGWKICEFLPMIYHPELAIKETTDTASSASFLDLYLEIDDSGQLSTEIYDFKIEVITSKVTEYLCHKWPRICSVCRNHNSILYPLMTYNRFIARATGKFTIGKLKSSLLS
jgi:hypothetical protein